MRRGTHLLECPPSDPPLTDMSRPLTDMSRLASLSTMHSLGVGQCSVLRV